MKTKNEQKSDFSTKMSLSLGLFKFPIYFNFDWFGSDKLKYNFQPWQYDWTKAKFNRKAKW